MALHKLEASLVYTEFSVSWGYIHSNDGETINQSHLVRVWLPGAQVEKLGGPRCALSERFPLDTESWTPHSCGVSFPLQPFKIIIVILKLA